jgi:deoxycytidine triphosphate deaminase
MPLGPQLLLKLVKDQKLVENLSERELTNPEGAGFDLRLGIVHKISGEAYLGIEERKSADAKIIQEYSKDNPKSITIKSKDQYLVTTIEKVNLPVDLTANFWLRRTLFRSGLILSGGNIAPGYSGTLSFTLFNSGAVPITIELGARIIHILFFRVEGEGSSYRGQWQGGRIVTSKKEKQV